MVDLLLKTGADVTIKNNVSADVIVVVNSSSEFVNLVCISINGSIWRQFVFIFFSLFASVVSMFSCMKLVVISVETLLCCWLHGKGILTWFNCCSVMEPTSTTETKFVLMFTKQCQFSCLSSDGVQIKLELFV